VLFRLREKFPQYCRSPNRRVLSSTIGSGSFPLTDEVKKVLARTAIEADAMGDAWVDTDHLLLGILCEPSCQATQDLAKAGVTLENARPLVLENQSSRPDYGPIIPLGQRPSLLVWLQSKWRWWRARRSEKRFAGQRQKIKETLFLSLP